MRSRRRQEHDTTRPRYHCGAVIGKREQRADEDLVLLALEGDEDAFACIVRRYQRRLTAFLGQLVGDIELARELAQEAFIRAWRALPRYDSH
ncbi:MAG: hypothetical protein GY906_20090, partial [bacterium]|nr:hypothetical protein [bacterium]